jgi:predicted Rdx family selenoprotein
MDEKQRQGTGKMEFDRQLCCACNHILHTAWFEQEDADGECAPISLGREY